MSAQKLLILDDDPQIGTVMRLIAESVGAEARAVGTARDFFLALDDWSPTHITLDLILPDMDGVEVLENLAGRKCAARIFVTSGLDPRILEAAGRSANEHGLNIAGVLPKPFTAQMLKNLLNDNKDPVPPAVANKTVPTGSAPPFAITSQELKEALGLDQIRAVYQPQIDCLSMRLAGFEALARWHHPGHGMVMPDVFVPVAEESGLIDELTEVMFGQVTEWLARNFPESHVTMAINISSKSAAGNVGVRLPMAERMLALCDSRHLDTSRVVLELTETSAMKDPVASLAVLTRLRMKGLQLAIDDFGTGYSSMLQLVRLPFSEIKIDRSFVATATRSPESHTVVKSIVDLGKSLGMRIVAEGVEDADTLALLRNLGCDLAQGYFISRPLAPDKAVAWALERSLTKSSGPVDNIGILP